MSDNIVEEEDNPNDLPPPYYEPPPKPEPSIVKFVDDARTAQAVTSEVAREALLRYIDNEHCCWGTGPAKECTIQTSVWISIVCKMETFVEYRTTAYEYRPYQRGSHVSLRNHGRETLPWEMQCPQAVYFQNSVTKYDIPFTSSIHRCNECNGDGKVRCHQCGGDGTLRCNRCNGDGRVSHRDHEGNERQETCDNCNGRGQTDCNFRDVLNQECRRGQINCPKCHGNGQLEKYLEMTRTLENIINTRTVDMIDDSELDPNLIAAAPGKTILNASAFNIIPPLGFSPDVDNALLDIDRQGTQDVQSRHAFLHQERLEIKSVPVSKAEAQVGESKFHFWVYGNDNRCVCKESWGYPSQVCCGCTIA